MKQLLTILFSLCLLTSVEADSFRISYENGRVIREMPDDTKPVIGLALSGGGARGFAHIGVIEVLREKGIRIERIAGTSMGSIVGGLYAAGYGTDAIRDIIMDIDWMDAFSSAPKRRSTYIGEKSTSEWPLFELRFDGFRARIPSSLSSGQKSISLLSWLTVSSTFDSDGDFDKLPIPFRAISTDIKSGKSLTIGTGNLGRAMQASSTIPLIFAPVEQGSMLLVDGGLKNNLPVGVAQKMGSDFVIAVAIDESMHKPEELDNPINIADQVTSIMMRGITGLSRNQADFVIEPDMDAYSSRNFTQIPAIIEQGRQAAMAAYPALKDSLSSAISHCGKARIETIAVSPESSSDHVLSIVSQSLITGSEIFKNDIADALEDVWSTGRYATISAEYDDRILSLIITVTPTPSTITVLLDSPDISADNDDHYTLSSLDNGNPSISATGARIDSLMHAIKLRGLSFATISGTEIDDTNDTLVIRVKVPTVKRIQIQQGLKSRDALVMREIEIEVGDVFDLGKVMDSVDNLYGTNLYELVYVDVEKRNGGVGLIINIKEKDWSVARFGLHYDETFRTEGRITLTRENILGYGSHFAATGHTGKKRQLIMLENKVSRIYKSLYSFNLKTYKDLRKRPVYDGQTLLYEFEDERYGTVLSVGQQMGKIGNAMFQFKTETIRTRYAPSVKIRKAKKEFRSFIFRSQIDSYDRYPFPKNGYMNQIFIESANDMLGGSEQFVKIYASNAFARTYWKRHTFSASLAVGSTDPSTPDIDQFTLGGQATKLNNYDPDSGASNFYASFQGLADEEKRGTRLAVAHVAYRLFIPRAFYLDLTYGIGNVWSRGVTIKADTLLQSYGITGSFSTYAGPVSFGWGITSEGDDRVYISAGREF